MAKNQVIDIYKERLNFKESPLYFCCWWSACVRVWSSFSTLSLWKSNQNKLRKKKQNKACKRSCKINWEAFYSHLVFVGKRFSSSLFSKEREREKRGWLFGRIQFTQQERPAFVFLWGACEASCLLLRISLLFFFNWDIYLLLFLGLLIDSIVFQTFIEDLNW